MIQTRLKKSALAWSGLFFSMVIGGLLIGQSIIHEGAKLIFSQRITTISSLQSESEVYQLSIPISQAYSGIDFIYEVGGEEVRIKGYINELSDGYYLVFTQKEISENTLFILSAATFSPDKINLFKQSVILQLSEETGLSQTEISALIHPTVFYDHTQRIKNDLPVVMMWSIVMFGLIYFAFRVSFRYFKVIKRKDVKEAHIWARQKKRYVLSSGILQLGANPSYVGFDEILLYELENGILKLKTKSRIFKIQGSEKLYAAITKKVVPEFIIKNT